MSTEREKLNIVSQRYIKMITDADFRKKIPPICAGDNEFIETTDHEHLIWMLVQIQEDESQELTKKHRWLGFVQGVLCYYCGYTTVEDERNFTRDVFAGS